VNWLEILLSITLAVLPGIVLAIGMYIRDHHEPEPLRLLMMAFFLGMLAFVLSLKPGKYLEELFSGYGSILESKALHAFGAVALVEELAKFIIIRSVFYKNRHFNEPLDGIVYSVMVSLGFATLENVFYVLNDGVASGFLRMFSAIPAHAMFAVVMGYYLGIGRFRHQHELRYAITGLAAAVFLHGAYDYFLFISFIPGMWSGAVVSFLAALWFSVRSIRIHTDASPFREQNENTGSLT
jgi:RsiW-degrading membrane proteinase PrsW (M82 family)